MLTDQEIQDRIQVPKKIIVKNPVNGYKQEDGNQRCDLTLERVDTEEIFSVFIRQNSQFIENYSIGLRYKTKNKTLGTITLVRYNGSHGEHSQHEDGHYNKPHIHRITAGEIQSGSEQPQESHREITDKFNTLEEALRVFFDDTGITNWLEYFPELNRTQMDIFNGH